MACCGNIRRQGTSIKTQNLYLIVISETAIKGLGKEVAWFALGVLLLLLLTVEGVASSSRQQSYSIQGNALILSMTHVSLVKVSHERILPFWHKDVQVALLLLWALYQPKKSHALLKLKWFHSKNKCCTLPL